LGCRKGAVVLKLLLVFIKTGYRLRH
jgi:hypothetical protein